MISAMQISAKSTVFKKTYGTGDLCSSSGHDIKRTRPIATALLALYACSTDSFGVLVGRIFVSSGSGGPA